MAKNIDIYDAITNLPDHLITDEIWFAGIEEGNLRILNILPQKFMTDENINKVIAQSEGKSNYYGFKLSNIPLEARTQLICDKAMDKDKQNLMFVPEDKRTNAMLRNFMLNVKDHINYLNLFPEKCWDISNLYEGIDSIYHWSSGQNNKGEDMKLIQIFLYYVPESLKNENFYIGLFNTKMNCNDISFLTPKKYKKERFYIAMARKDVKSLPIERLDCHLMTEALLSDKNNDIDFWGDWQNKNKELKNKLYELLDNKMVDIILKRWPERFSAIPEKFQTKKRLIYALSFCKNSSRSSHNIYGSFKVEKFDSDICKAIVKLEEYNCPKIAAGIWTPDFIEFCQKNAKQYRWFVVMPVELQTQEMANTVFNLGISNIRNIRPDLITYDMAIKAYLEKEYNGQSKYEDYIPDKYLKDFVLETGLPKEFFGGQTTYSDVKDNHKPYKYFSTGDCFIGYYVDKDERYEMNRLIMTRRTPMQIKPSIVFNRTVQTFHKTWLEKLVCDNDTTFVKPIPGKGLKGKQINLYIDVHFLQTYCDVKIYAHTFLGETILYSADYMERDSLELIKAAIDDQIQNQLKAAV